MGVPAVEFAAEDGGKDLVYPRGPLGVQTFIAHVGRNGTLEEIRPVLKDEVFRRIQPGLTQDEVLRMIGPPGDKMHFAMSNTTAWDYRFVDTWGYTAIFSAVFDARGVLVSKFSQRLIGTTRTRSACAQAQDADRIGVAGVITWRAFQFPATPAG